MPEGRRVDPHTAFRVIAEDLVLVYPAEQLHPLADGLYEFRKQPKRGAKPRVVWFFDGPSRVVCAVAFFKRDKTPERLIDQARSLKRAYFQAKAARTLVIVDLPRKG